MKKNAIYPGTFDPITYGHIDVIKKALKIVDQVIVAISEGNYKNHLFDVEERISIIKKALFKDLNLKKNKIEVVSFNSLTTSLCKKYKSNIILRGLRAVSDFEYEFQLAGMNRKLNKNIETIFLMSDVENQIISSKFANFIRSFILKDKCPDTGCSLKVFTKNVYLKFPFFNGIHRFLPALFLRTGHQTCFVNVDHRPRIYGKSKYGTIKRMFGGMIDLINVSYMINKYNKKNV